jgi:hypothetical protein
VFSLVGVVGLTGLGLADHPVAADDSSPPPAVSPPPTDSPPSAEPDPSSEGPSPTEALPSVAPMPTALAPTPTPNPPSPSPTPTLSPSDGATAPAVAPDVEATTDLGVTQALADFADAAAWRVISGSAVLTTAQGPAGTGSAVQVAYDLSQVSQTYLGSSSMPAELGGLPGVVALDIHGDRSWNVVYLQVRDGTGEIFHYRMGNLGFDGWRTLTVDLRSARPATTLWGNQDGLLDLPLTPFRIVVDRGPNAQALTSTIWVANLRCVCPAWEMLTASPSRFVATAGETTRLRMSLGDATSYELVLRDEVGGTFTWTGVASGNGVVSRQWNGRTDAGAAMRGSIRARVTVVGPDAHSLVGIPYLAGIPASRVGAAGIVGINTFLGELTPARRADAEAQARLMESARVSMAREDFDWNRIEPRKGEYNWAVFDQAVQVTRAHNVGMLGKLVYSASWASSAPAGTPSREAQFYPPVRLPDYLDYVRAVVTRYRDDVHHWEVWNEPNLWRFWRPVRDPAAYAEMLKQTYAVIKSIDPTATVVLGGLVGTDLTYLDALRSHGAWTAFDVLNIHSFVINAPEASGLVGWLDRARAYTRRHGSKPVWVTEACWPTVAAASSPYPPVTEAQQALYVPRAYLVAAGAGAERMFWYSLLDHDSGTGSRYDSCGLVASDGRQKPAYDSFKQLGLALHQAVPAGPIASSDRTVVSGMDRMTGWSVAGIGGGAGTLRISGTPRFGSGALQLDYRFGASSTGVSVAASMPIAGSPTSLSVWVRGDGSANPVYLAFTDAKGERFSGAVGSLQDGWQRLTLHLDGGQLNWAHGGDGRIDYPITVRAITIYRGGLGALSGSAIVDQLEAGYGPPVRGVAFVRSGQTLQSLYLLSQTTVGVPITGVTAQLMTSAGWRNLQVPAKGVELALNAAPRHLLSGPEVLPAKITPNGDLRNDSALFRWASGDAARSTLQVYALTGRLLRTLQTDMVTRAGIASARWDGKLRDANGTVIAAPPGTYVLRLTVYGLDGRRAILAKNVVVESWGRPVCGLSGRRTRRERESS